MTFFWIFISLLIIQRIAELFIAKRNEKILRAKGALEFDRKGYFVIVVMHVCFFISLVGEKVILERELSYLWFIFLAIFLIAQVLRYWAIKSLRIFWNTKVLVVPNTTPVAEGPYKYIRHPNYVAVITEIAVIPLLFSCYITAIVFSILNLILLRRRIKIEEEALEKLS